MAYNMIIPRHGRKSSPQCRRRRSCYQAQSVEGRCRPCAQGCERHGYLVSFNVRKGALKRLRNFSVEQFESLHSSPSIVTSMLASRRSSGRQASVACSHAGHLHCKPRLSPAPTIYRHEQGGHPQRQRRFNSVASHSHTSFSCSFRSD